MKKSLLKVNVAIGLMLIVMLSIVVNNVVSVKASADSRVIYAGDTTKSNVCFMVNVYGEEECVKQMLDIFDVYNVKTTFFVGGCWAVKNIEVVKEIYSRGHEIGNHGFYHKDQDKLDYEANIQEINMCHKVVAENIGVEMKLFAPPSGAYSSITVDASESLNYKTIMWTRDTIDWRDQDSDLIFRRATKNLSNGDLILMHPTKKTVEALTNILSTSINNGFNPTTVSNCL